MKTLITKKPSFKYLLFIAGLSIWLCACKSHDKPADDEDSGIKAQTPVTVISIDKSAMADYIELNATSVFQQKNYIKANATGYIQQVNALLGHFVSKGELLFTIKTKEAQAIGGSINILDTTFKFTGISKIKSPEHGYITQLSHQTGDYVQDGEALATISERSSFVFIMQLPYELRSYVKTGQNIQLTLPGGNKLDAHIASFMPSVDTVAQTQGVVLKVNTHQQIPENLVAKARIVKAERSNTLSLPKAALLANEIQTEFWVMKLINPTTAVKVMVTKGIESSDKVEILSPKFTAEDKIIISGNYGLPDTAKVKIIQ